MPSVSVHHRSAAIIDRRRFLVGCSSGLVAVTGCLGSPEQQRQTVDTPTSEPDDTPTGEPADTPMELESSAFEDGGSIPEMYTCDGADSSPPLAIVDVPENCAALALVVDDPDAPGGTFTHWLLWNVPPDRSAIPPELPDASEVEAVDGARQGTNDFGTIGYRGPCPPTGSTHTYRFTLYALSSTMDVDAGAGRDAVRTILDEQTIATDRLTGTYGR